MKKSIASLFCSVMTMMTFGWAGIENSGTDYRASSEMIYISPEDLHFSDQSMFVFMGEEWQQVSALYSDARGFFIRLPESQMWYCSNCKKHHPNNQECPEVVEKEKEKERKKKRR